MKLNSKFIAGAVTGGVVVALIFGTLLVIGSRIVNHGIDKLAGRELIQLEGRRKKQFFSHQFEAKPPKGVVYLRTSGYRGSRDFVSDMDFWGNRDPISRVKSRFRIDFLPQPDLDVFKIDFLPQSDPDLEGIRTQLTDWANHIDPESDIEVDVQLNDEGNVEAHFVLDWEFNLDEARSMFWERATNRD